MSAKHTQGPWRWEFNRKHKSMHLVGGVPTYDLTIMESERWGMQHTTLVLRDTSVDGMNIMHRLCDRADWIAPFPNRAHHADWCASIVHPDAVLMAAAPELLEALKLILPMAKGYAAAHPVGSNAAYCEQAADVIARATGAA